MRTSNQIARNLAVGERRSRGLHRTLEERQARERPPVRTPVRDFESTEVREVVQRAIESLPERRREVFVLAHLQDLPHREIAEFMGISLQTVANQISAARVVAAVHRGAQRQRSPELGLSGDPG